MKYLQLLMILLLSSCGLPYCHKVQLTEDDLKWINHYNVNDTKLFSSNKNSIDTIIVKDIQVRNPKNTNIFDTEGQNWMEGDNEYYGFAYVDMTLRHSADSFLISFEIKRIDKNGPLISSCNFCEWSWLKITMDIKPFILLNRKYEDCFCVDTNEMERNSGDQPIINLRNVVWNKNFGLLQYSLNDGSIYSIIK